MKVHLVLNTPLSILRRGADQESVSKGHWAGCNGEKPGLRSVVCHPTLKACVSHQQESCDDQKIRLGSGSTGRKTGEEDDIREPNRSTPTNLQALVVQIKVLLCSAGLHQSGIGNVLAPSCSLPQGTEGGGRELSGLLQGSHPPQERLNPILVFFEVFGCSDLETETDKNG